MIPEQVYRESIRGFLQPVVEYLDDPAVSEVLINGPNEVFVERAGQLIKTSARFSSEAALMSALRNIAQYVARPLEPGAAVLEARLPDGARVQAVLPPLATPGPSVAIRRFSRQSLTLDRIVQQGGLSAGAAQLLAALVEAKQNILVSGGTGSGKTSLLNLLASLIPSGERIVVIEDARELQISHEHVLQLEARPAQVRGPKEVTVRDLFRATLRLRPDRIVIGEIRGPEALELIAAMTSGHGGCLSTLHASYPRDALHRLETLALMSGVELPLFALRAQVTSAVDVIVQTARLRDGRRAVTHITELVDCDPRRGYRLQDLFVLQSTAGGGERSLQPTGARPRCTPALMALGMGQRHPDRGRDD